MKRKATSVPESAQPKRRRLADEMDDVEQSCLRVNMPRTAFLRVAGALQQLGSGISANVYAGCALNDQDEPDCTQQFALKIQRLTSPVTTAGFEDEVDIHRAMNRVDVGPTLYGAFTCLDGAFGIMVMEQYDTMLTEAMFDALPLDAQQRVVDDIRAQLERMHAAGYVHNDIWIDNVFVRRAPDGRVQVMIADFGLAGPRSKWTPTSRDMRFVEEMEQRMLRNRFWAMLARDNFEDGIVLPFAVHEQDLQEDGVLERFGNRVQVWNLGSGRYRYMLTRPDDTVVEQYFVGDQLHREDGPAEVHRNANGRALAQYWYVHGQRQTPPATQNTEDELFQRGSARHRSAQRALALLASGSDSD